MGGNCQKILQCNKDPTINVPHSIENDSYDANLKYTIDKYDLKANKTIYLKNIDIIVKLQSVIKGYIYYLKFKKDLRRKKNQGLHFTTASKDVMIPLGFKVEVARGALDPRNLPKDGIRKKFKEIHIETHKFYEGEWLDGKRDGFGKLKWNDGSIYIGQFINDKAKGFGKLTHADGDVYLGSWEEDRAHGVGKYINNRGASYEGFWGYDKQNGYGNEIWPKGSNFEGEYVDGAKHGIGILNLEDNAYYKGQFRDNDINGIGTFYFKDGRKYEGEWKFNKMFGYGVLTWPDGKYFEGFFINDKKEGFGVYFALSKVYIGYWKNSKLDGEVILIEKGNIKKSLWHDGKKVQYLANDYKVNFEKLVDPIMATIKNIN
jgi:hypothetical protein